MHWAHGYASALPLAAGKTTLMDCLAGRKTEGRITGDIRVSGVPVDQCRGLARALGYVEQTDVHVPEATVAEALAFSAALRLPADVSADAREAFTREVHWVEMKKVLGSTRKHMSARRSASPAVPLANQPTGGSTLATGDGAGGAGAHFQQGGGNPQRVGPVRGAAQGACAVERTAPGGAGRVHVPRLLPSESLSAAAGPPEATPRLNAPFHATRRG